MRKLPDRKTWLREAARRLRPWLRAAGASVPRSLTVRHGPMPERTSRRFRWHGYCVLIDGRPRSAEVVIADRLRSGPLVLEVLAHELTHAAAFTHCHNGPFRPVAVHLGFPDGNLTYGRAGASLRVRLRELAQALGPYPPA